MLWSCLQQQKAKQIPRNSKHMRIYGRETIVLATVAERIEWTLLPNKSFPPLVSRFL